MEMAVAEEVPPPRPFPDQPKPRRHMEKQGAEPQVDLGPTWWRWLHPHMAKLVEAALADRELREGCPPLLHTAKRVEVALDGRALLEKCPLLLCMAKLVEAALGGRELRERRPLLPHMVKQVEKPPGDRWPTGPGRVAC